MAGHSKWHNIKHRKAAVDKKRGKLWTKAARAIIVAAKNGGGDPDSNLPLRYAIDEARYVNMPKDTIERAIKKGTGAGQGENYEAIRYEGYGPGGVAVLVEALTDNRARTAGDVRLAFTKVGGSLGASGCVAYLFQNQGQIALDAGGLDEDKLVELAGQAGAEDVVPPEGAEDPWIILTAPTTFLHVRTALEQGGFKVSQAQLAFVPETVASPDPKAAADVAELVETLEELDDVQRVWTNAPPSTEGEDANTKA